MKRGMWQAGWMAEALYKFSSGQLALLYSPRRIGSPESGYGPGFHRKLSGKKRVSSLARLEMHSSGPQGTTTVTWHAATKDDPHRLQWKPSGPVTMGGEFQRAIVALPGNEGGGLRHSAWLENDKLLDQAKEYWRLSLSQHLLRTRSSDVVYRSFVQRDTLSRSRMKAVLLFLLPVDHQTHRCQGPW